MNRIQERSLRKRVSRIVHNRIVIVRQAQRVHILRRQLVEIVLLADHDVVALDDHMILAIRSCVLVPETDHMAQLVHNDAELVAVLAYGDGLAAVAAFADKRAATVRDWECENSSVLGSLVLIPKLLTRTDES